MTHKNYYFEKKKEKESTTNIKMASNKMAIKTETEKERNVHWSNRVQNVCTRATINGLGVQFDDDDVHKQKITSKHHFK